MINADEQMTNDRVRFIKSRWPTRIWSAGRLIAVTSLSPKQSISWLNDRLKEDFGYSAQLEDVFDEGVEAAGTTHLRPFPWSPRSRWAVFDSAVEVSGTGSVISGDLRLPYYPVAISAVGVALPVVMAVLGQSPAPLIIAVVFGLIYFAGRFISLPQASRSLPEWFRRLP